MDNTEGFILSRQWQEHDDGQDLIFWLVTDNGPLRVVIERQPSIFFVAASNLDQVIQLLPDIDGYRYDKVDLKTFTNKEDSVALYFRSQRDLNFARSRLEKADIVLYEADLRPTDRFLMERFVRGAAMVWGDILAPHTCINPKVSSSSYMPALKVISLDIETSFTENILYSIALYGASERRVLMVSNTDLPENDNLKIECFQDEKSLLLRFLDWADEFDPDAIIGWSVVNFDLHFLQKRCDELGIEFSLGRLRQAVAWRTDRSGNRSYALVPGRVVLDGIELLRTATYSFESFSLEFVARQLLGEGKLVQDVDSRAVEIQQLYANDRLRLAEYNLQDCRLVWDIFNETDLINFAIERSRLTGLDMDRAGGSVAAFDFLYLPHLHREGFVAPVAGEHSDGASPGGFVLESKAGLYENVIVLDFKSLYPSIIRTFHVDPLALITAGDDAIPGFKDGRFSRQRTILPNIIEQLWQARDNAKREGHGAMSQAIKIIMNSFYGVLGTPACRFFDTRLASSITMRGHEILQKTRDLIEARGYPVIYGDTDSVFVHLVSDADVPQNLQPTYSPVDMNVDDERRSSSQSAKLLVDYLNRWWRDELAQRYSIPSFLELEYETHFEKFLMPTVRGSEKGSKKRYAGLVAVDGTVDDNRAPRLVFKGLETVRSDWSRLAREFQQELYRRVFLGEPFEEYIKQIVEEVQLGKRDDQLVLRRRMRRKITDYVRNVPPHVRAARMAQEIRVSRGLPESQENGGWIEYVMTVNGPEPRRYLDSRIDYGFYVDRQLAPVADAILTFKSSSLKEITDRQLSLF